jgi:hypothetical protein
MVNKTRGIIIGTFKFTAVVGLYVLIIPLFAFNWPWDQSLGVYLLISMSTPIYGSSLEETIKRLSLCFTNYDNHTNKVAVLFIVLYFSCICYSTQIRTLTPLCYSTLLHFISFYFIAIYFSCICFTHCILFSKLLVISINLFIHTPYSS